MITRRSLKTVLWVDAESPTQDEIRALAMEFHLNPLVGHELSAPSRKPKVEMYAKYIYLILHFPRQRRDRNAEQNHEIDFIVGKKFLITVRYTASEPMHVFSKMVETNVTLGKNEFGTHAGFLFFHMLGKLYESVHYELSAGSDSLRDIEQKIFDGKERQMVVSLSLLSRNLLEIKRALSLHRDVLESFAVAGKMLFGQEFAFQLQTLIGNYGRVEKAVENNLALLVELRETNNSLLDTKENETMRVITVIAFLTIPVTVITNFFQLSTSHTPIIGMPYDWVIIVSLTLLGTSVLFWFAKKKQWF